MIRIIKELEKVLTIKLIPLQTNTIEECVVYKFYQTSSFDYKLELRVIAFSLEKAELYSKQVIAAINDVGDTHKVEGISSIALNGGGVLIDNETNTTQRLMFFDVTAKE